MCSEYCEGEDFFGIQYGSECWCGSTGDGEEDVFRHGSATCEYPCAGDDEETCGGYVVKDTALTAFWCLSRPKASKETRRLNAWYLQSVCTRVYTVFGFANATET